MASADRAVPLAKIRAAVNRSVAATSLRQVARDVGMSPTGLQKFLSGSEPYSATRRKLELWYSKKGRAPSLQTALESLEILVQELTPDDRSEAIRGILGAVRSEYVKRGEPVPAWVEEIEKGST